MKKLKYIDAVRGIAVLGVLMVHCGISNGTSSLFQNFVHSGARGVQLFYVASALTLFFSLENRKLTEKNQTFNFFIRRFFRIAPMYYIGIVYYGILVLHYGLGAQQWLGASKDLTVSTLVSNIFFIHGYSPYWINSIVPGGWSIAVEMTFYCFVPFLFNKIKNLNHAILFFAAAVIMKYVLQVVLYKLHLIADNELWTLYLNLYFPSQLPVFACGVILYFLIRTPQKDWYISPVLIVLLTLLFLFQMSTGFTLFTEHIVFSIGFVFLCFSLSKREFYVLVNPLTIYIGKISFSMYLVHFAVLNWMTFMEFDSFFSFVLFDNQLFHFGIRFVFLTIVSIIVSTVFYWLVEIPFQKLGKKLINRLEFSSVARTEFSNPVIKNSYEVTTNMTTKFRNMP